MGADLLAMSNAYLQKRLLADRQHAPRAACTVVKQVRTRFDLIGNGQEDEIRHQANGIAGRPVFARLFVVLLVEPAHKFLENRAHRMVVESSRAQVYIGVEKFVDQRAEGVGLRKG